MKIKRTVLLISSALLFFNCSFAQDKPVKKTTSHTATPTTSVARGKIVYTSICLACHMADGAGVPTMNPPLIKTSYVLGDKATLIKIVLNGFKEDVEINGQKYSNNMTPHSDLKDQEIADVLTYVRKSFGNKASSITVADVKKIRAANVVTK
ncbi:MAG TPA: cytochrome c [Mucilaginibacter sp.]|jgi:mono/diheme cytochrome c family protein